MTKSLLRKLWVCTVFLVISCSSLLANAKPVDQPEVFLEQLTTSEVRDRLTAGTTTILVPIGGTEQSGPYITLGKHNVRAHVLAGQIARRLGNALVAPVIAYVPEGAITPPSGHMRFPGTISIPDATFESLLEATARSFRQHGFRDIIFLGDHGGYQKSEEKVANKLNHEWAADPRCRVRALLEYYRITQTAFVEDLRHQGYSDSDIGLHAGLADTALMLAVDPSQVRSEAMQGKAKPGERDGVSGDPRRATATSGQRGIERVIETSVNTIQSFVQQHAEQTASIKPRR